MKRLALVHCTMGILWGASALLGETALGESAGDQGWGQLFNGKDLTGWKTHPKSPGKWQVQDGAIVGGGAQVSHLFSDRDDYENFHYRIEAKINDKGNSGQYFRTQFGSGYPKGYEVQINSTHSDAIRTGSLYPGGDLKLGKDDRAKLVEKAVVKERLHEPDVWFTQEVIADGNRIQILVNGKKTVDWVDERNTYTKGHFAIQQHDPYKDKKSGKVIESVITVRKIEIKELPPTKK